MYPHSVEEEEKTFLLQPGYDMEPVLTDPDIMEPAAIKFDGNGRMYVLELRSYMQDLDATSELAPISQISRWEDTDNDGRYDHHTVFLDRLVFPRFVLRFGENTILSMESNKNKVYKYTDTDDDGVADKKEFFASGMGRAGNVEHQTSFLTWGLDNWLYTTYNAVRIRWTPNGVLKESTGSPGGQWGVTQDNYGKIWYQGGASGVPSYFQFPILYGRFRVGDQFQEGFRVPHGEVRLGDYQPGMDQINPDGSLKRVTAGSGNDVYRGDRLPEELQGDYLYGEVVARIVRRATPEVSEGLTHLGNPYQSEKSEFIRSTDPLFRPVDMATAPDGTMYIVDMYRGIIQEGNWTRPGSYLRTKIQQYQLDKVIRRGRIWRLTYDGINRDTTQPRMFDETPKQLVRHLEHPNGWWRDKAQQLLVLRQDKSVVPALQNMAKSSDKQLARIHALWTLEGLGALNTTMVRSFMEDPNPQIRIQGIRASETLYKYGVKSLAADYRELTKDPNTNVAIQAMMTLNVLDVPDVESVIRSTQASDTARGVQLVGDQILDALKKKQNLAASGYTPKQQALYKKGADIYDNFCSSCHGENGLGTPIGDPGGPTLAPALSGSKRVQAHREYVVKTLLHGLEGPIEGQTYAGSIMTPMGANTDEWVASVASYIRNSMGNKGLFVTPEYVSKIRAATAEQKTTYTFDELINEIPRPLEPQKSWTVSASSSRGGDPVDAFTYAGWKTDQAQEPGMWFQVEFPDPVSLTEIQFDSPPKRRGRGPDAPPPLMTCPQEYKVQVSKDGSTWSQPVAEGECNDSHTIIAFKPVEAKHVRITQTGNAEEAFWSMQMLRLYVK